MDRSNTSAPLSSREIAGYAVGTPIGLLLLLFWPAGSLGWAEGWIFIAFVGVAIALSVVVLARINPALIAARRRIRTETEGWDKSLLSMMLPSAAAVMPVAALDSARLHWSNMPTWLVVLGYAFILVAVVLTAWAQAVNPFYEPGVRIQSDRGQRVIDTGPYSWVRHPGYNAALFLFAGMALALGSFWALVPAAIAGMILILRTAWEDRLLDRELAGYGEYALRVRSRLVPGVW